MRYFENVDFDSMTEDEIDDLYRPQCTNSRKSMSPLFVYLILKKHTNWDRHFTQKQILDKLEREYGVKIERKALSRILHQLSDEDIQIVTSERQGVWFDQGGKECA